MVPIWKYPIGFNVIYVSLEGNFQKQRGQKSLTLVIEQSRVPPPPPGWRPLYKVQLFRVPFRLLIRAKHTFGRWSLATCIGQPARLQHDVRNVISLLVGQCLVLLFWQCHVSRPVSCCASRMHTRRLLKVAYNILVGIDQRAWQNGPRNMIQLLFVYCHLDIQRWMQNVDLAVNKEYYEIVDESRPLSLFFPHMLLILQKYISNHENEQASKYQSDPSRNCFTIIV